MPRIRMMNLHVPLPEPLYRRLRDEAERTGQPATALAREAIDCWLDQQRRRAVHDAIQAYARVSAGSEVDLDEDLEAAGVELLVSREES